MRMFNGLVAAWSPSTVIATCFFFFVSDIVPVMIICLFITQCFKVA